VNLLKKLPEIAAKVSDAILRMIDLRDVFVFGGLAAVGYGVAQIHTPSAWIIIGGAVLVLGLRR